MDDVRWNAPPPLAPTHACANEPCSILVGWKRRYGVMREFSSSGLLIGGVGGLSVGDAVTVVLSQRLSVALAARVNEVSIQGVRLVPNGLAGIDDWHRIFLEVARRLAG